MTFLPISSRTGPETSTLSLPSASWSRASASAASSRRALSHANSATSPGRKSPASLSLSRSSRSCPSQVQDRCRRGGQAEG